MSRASNATTPANGQSSPRCCIIGHPVAHSRSPLIHGHWLKQHGLAGSYGRQDVPPEDLARFIQRMREGEFQGGNVTVPHKVAVMPLLDDVTDRARAAGAVNTLYHEGGRLMGDNTDVTGFLAHLDSTAPGWSTRVQAALVLGAGGAARAIVLGLAERKLPRILIANRNQARAEELAAWAGPSAQAVAWEARSQHAAGSGLIVNATSLGMKGQPPLEIDLTGMAPGTVVNDIVYSPLETGLLARAGAGGAIVVDGLGMLLHQAAPGFARWFGVNPEVTPALRALVVADLERTGA
jgi:shikimate dehydrogenase